MKLFITLLISLIAIEFVQAQSTITGKVIDDITNTPIAFANVSVIALPDSSFVKGTVTAENGKFTLDEIPANAIVSVSFIGYKTVLMPVGKDGELGVIRLGADVQVLDEVVVQAKMFHHTSEGIVANVANSTLSKLGNANDVLAHLPFVSRTDDAFTVFGKGEPIIYVNNRLLRDNEELKQLNSADIKSVKVITNPGAEYDATVNAVIRIMTTTPVGEGWGGSMSSELEFNRKFSHDEKVEINYRKGGLDIFGSLRGFRNVNRFNQKDTALYNNRIIGDEAVYLWDLVRYNGSLGFNSQTGDKQTLGARYDFTYSPMRNTCRIEDNLHSYYGNANIYNAADVDNRDSKTNVHKINAYYKFNFSEQTFLRIDADYAHGTNWESQFFENNNSDGTSGYLQTDNKRKYDLYAGKLTFATPLLGGNAIIGNEYSHTENSQDYTVADGTIPNGLTSNNSQSTQSLAAVFAAYSYKVGDKFSITAGLRYENAKFDYLVNGRKEDDASKIYSGFYPSATIAYENDDVQLSLSYRYTTRRPIYFYMRNTVAYNNPYTYEGGNPYLKPEKKNSLTFSFSWKDIQIMAIYSKCDNTVELTQEMYNGSDSIVFFRYNNIDDQSLMISCAYSPTIGIWTPNIELSMIKPFLKYSLQHYNKPIFDVTMENLIKLPQKYILGCDLWYNTCGNSGIRYLYNDFGMDLYCIKFFLRTGCG